MTTWHNVELVQYLAIAAEVQEVHLTDFVSKLIQEEDGGFGLCCSKEVAQYEAAPEVIHAHLRLDYSTYSINVKLLNAFSEYATFLAPQEEPDVGAFSSIPVGPSSQSNQPLKTVLADLLSQALNRKLAALLTNPCEITEVSLAASNQVVLPPIHEKAAKSPKKIKESEAIRALLKRRYEYPASVPTSTQASAQPVIELSPMVPAMGTTDGHMDLPGSPVPESESREQAFMPAGPQNKYRPEGGT